MRRRRSREDDSLDMLLDTISNTFGGILFLTLLVALLVHSNKSTTLEQQSQSVSQHELTQLRKGLATKTIQLQSLSQVLATQQQTLADFKPSQSHSIIERILELKSKKLALVQQRMDLTASWSRLANENTNLDKELQDRSSRHRQSQQDIARLFQQLKKEVRKRTRMARLPALRTTQKQEFALVMRYGRLYFLHASKLDKQLGSLNYEDFVVLKREQSTVRITPKPYAGLAVDASGSLEEALQGKLQHLSSKELYLAIAVWEDSFREFEHLRTALVNIGWEYRLIPVEEQGSILESHTENPLVQ